MTKVRAYRNGKAVKEQIYEEDQYTALNQFRDNFPEYSDCIIVAEDYTSEDDHQLDYMLINKS